MPRWQGWKLVEELVNLLPAEENVSLRAMRHRNSFLTLNRRWTGDSRRWEEGQGGEVDFYMEGGKVVF
jgi:hypothetical protein